MRVLAAVFVLALACVAGTSAAPAAPVPVEGSGTECLICQFLVKELDQYLTSPATVSKIVGYIEDVCHLVPSSDRDACKSFVDQYGQQLVDWIASELSSNEICDNILKLGCSTSDALKVAVQASAQRFVEAKLGSTCDICKTVISALQQALSDPQTEKDIVQAITSVCSGLGALKNICVDLVDDWAPDVINWLDEKLDPNAVCKDIHVCSVAMKVNGDLLGAKRCTFGPSYWCQSEDTAIECGALEHCRTKVWSQQE
ncbi:hypothetical protein PTSG_10051 [Salpingoeca rosetta]|uniref:Saposin B-type domain-containing protein n=1 Tax=Salpingoeca rosetta (strain ATCC 50818 / BSB-021) TaxID=946362 RepID=F2UPD1_SALR5|nr:uncharacterized protein PTSG_10051 [Salpingoeca rosetta]EGD79486.1 hypothetical protein PTSG_10051 [Salpingoeca rosetta]|eukprot:XP_004988967.1 hypothetical protein PTSG_10051 [Salpingoeca rosetta]